jgi:hypothetical protein
MSTKDLRLSDLKGRSQQDVAQILAAMARERHSLNGEAAALDLEIADLETRYEMSSGAMQQGLRNQTVRETADLCRWQILLALRDGLAGAATP